MILPEGRVAAKAWRAANQGHSVLFPYAELFCIYSRLHFNGNYFSGLVIRMRYSEPCGHRGFTPPGVWAAYRCCLYPYGSQARLRLKRAARGRGPGTAAPTGPLQPPAPAVCPSALTRRPTGLARVARCVPKSPRVNVQQLNISFSTTVSGWHCATRREAAPLAARLPYG